MPAPEKNGRAGAVYRFNSASAVALQTFALSPSRPGAKLGFAPVVDTKTALRALLRD